MRRTQPDRHVHRTHLYPRQWAFLTRTGERLDAPPDVNAHGTDIRSQVADVLERLGGDAT